MQHPWLHVLNSTAGTCVLCLKYNPSLRTRTFLPDLKTLDDHAVTKGHLASKTQHDRDLRWLEQLARVGTSETSVDKLEAQLQAALASLHDHQIAERCALIAGRPLDPAAHQHAAAVAHAAGEALSAGRAELAAAQAACDPEMVIVHPLPGEQLNNCLATAAAKAATVKSLLGSTVDALGVRSAVNEIQTILCSLDKMPPAQKGKFDAAARCCFTCLGTLKRGRPMLEYEGAMDTAIALGDIPADSLYCNDDFGWRFAEVANLVLVQVWTSAETTS